MSKKCNCYHCKLGIRIKKWEKNKDIDDLIKIIYELDEALECEGTDAVYYKSILNGSWGDRDENDEIITRYGLIRVKEYSKDISEAIIREKIEQTKKYEKYLELTQIFKEGKKLDEFKKRTSS